VSKYDQWNYCIIDQIKFTENEIAVSFNAVSDGGNLIDSGEGDWTAGKKTGNQNQLLYVAGADGVNYLTGTNQFYLTSVSLDIDSPTQQKGVLSFSPLRDVLLLGNSVFFYNAVWSLATLLSQADLNFNKDLQKLSWVGKPPPITEQGGCVNTIKNFINLYPQALCPALIDAASCGESFYNKYIQQTSGLTQNLLCSNVSNKPNNVTVNDFTKIAGLPRYVSGRSIPVSNVKAVYDDFNYLEISQVVFSNDGITISFIAVGNGNSPSDDGSGDLPDPEYSTLHYYPGIIAGAASATFTTNTNRLKEGTILFPPPPVEFTWGDLTFTFYDGYSDATILTQADLKANPDLKTLSWTPNNSE
jgi:hypothetical protein